MAEEEKPYLVFNYCKDKCLKTECKECGYFWGPGHPFPGTRPYWISSFKSINTRDVEPQ